MVCTSQGLVRISQALGYKIYRAKITYFLRFHKKHNTISKLAQWIYDIFIDEVAYAMESHSPEIEWFYDFDARTIVANMPFGDCQPEKNHRLLPIEPSDSREGFRMMVS